MTSDQLARDWIGYALGLAEADRRRHGDAIDWEQVGLDALWSAVRGFRPGPTESFSVAYIRRHYTGWRSNARQSHARKAGRLVRAGLLPDSLPGRECDPAFLAELRDEGILPWH